VGIKLKDFDVDFDEIKIKMPDGEGLKVKISEQLLVNQSLPADLMEKMVECAPKYARWGVVRGDLSDYRELLVDEYDEFIKQKKNIARKPMSGNPAETKVEEKAVLDNLKEHLERKKKIRKVNSALEKVKRVMRAFEIQAELMRSMKATIRKEEKMFEEEDAKISEEGHTSLTENIKVRRKRNG